MEQVLMHPSLVHLINNEANNAGSERMIEFFDLLAGKIDNFYLDGELSPVIEVDLDTTEVKRGVNAYGVECLAFYDADVDSIVVFDRTGRASFIEDEQLSYEELYEKLRDVYPLELPEFDPVAREDEEEEELEAEGDAEEVLEEQEAERLANEDQ